MGEVEKCPKCRAKLRFASGGYARSAVNQGNTRCALPDSYSCIMCGYYREIFPEFVTPQEFKKDFVRREYPEHRKTLGDIGWLRAIIKEHFSTLTYMRSKGHSWAVVQKAMAKVEPLFAKAEKTSVCTGYTRELKVRGESRESHK